MTGVKTVKAYFDEDRTFKVYDETDGELLFRCKNKDDFLYEISKRNLVFRLPQLEVLELEPH